MDSKRMYTTWYQKYQQKHNQHNDGFVKWMDEIEQSVFKQIRMYLLDLPDEDWSVWYTDGFSSGQVLMSSPH